MSTSILQKIAIANIRHNFGSQQAVWREQSKKVSQRKSYQILRVSNDFKLNWTPLKQSPLSGAYKSGVTTNVSKLSCLEKYVLPRNMPFFWIFCRWIKHFISLRSTRIFGHKQDSSSLKSRHLNTHANTRTQPHTGTQTHQEISSRHEKIDNSKGLTRVLQTYMNIYLLTSVQSCVLEVFETRKMRLCT